MSVANRLKRLLDLHGHSYAKAEEITCVSRETIRRIANGEQPPKLPIYLRKIAAGYGVDEFMLLEGATPKGEFEWTVRHSSPAQRLEWLLMSQAGRVKLTLDFLRARYPQLVPPRVLAAAARISEHEVLNLVDRWEIVPPDRRVALDLAHMLHSLTGISLAWFLWGGLAERWSQGVDELARVSRWTRTSGITKELMQSVTRHWR